MIKLGFRKIIFFGLSLLCSFKCNSVTYEKSHAKGCCSCCSRIFNKLFGKYEIMQKQDGEVKSSLFVKTYPHVCVIATNHIFNETVIVVNNDDSETSSLLGAEIHLLGKSAIWGDVKFIGQPGKVFLSEDSEILGDVVNGKVEEVDN